MTVHWIDEADRSQDYEVVHYTPAGARSALARNTRNRPLSRARVATLKLEMYSGRWQYNGEAIKWSRDGVLLDGQHRLTAIAEMPDTFKPLPILTVYGLPPESQDTMDQGARRSAGDQLAIDGLSSTDQTIVASAIRVLIIWSTRSTPKERVDYTISNPRVVEWARNNPEKMDLLADIRGWGIKSIKCRPGVVLAAFYLMAERDYDMARAFHRGLSTGVGLGEGSPILALKFRLGVLSDQKARLQDHDALGYFFSAWNAYRKGEPRDKIQRAKKGWAYATLPEPI